MRYTTPLPSLSERRPFYPPDFGRCPAFTVPDGQVYAKTRPTEDNHLGWPIKGEVFVRCKAGFEYSRGFQGEYLCVGSKWVAGADEEQEEEGAEEEDDDQEPSCVPSMPAVLVPRKTYGKDRHLTCLDDLIQQHPSQGAPPSQTMDRRSDVRAGVLSCFGCVDQGSVDWNCGKYRAWEFEDVTCTRVTRIGGPHKADYCLVPKIVQATAANPCIVLTVGVGYIWDVENDLTQRWNCTTYMFDPTPGSGLGLPLNELPKVAGYRRQYNASLKNRPMGNWMERAGIASTDREEHMQGSAQFGQSAGQVSFLTIGSMLQRIGEKDGSRVALFKIDVEGYEFDVLEQVIAQHFTYINIDFHTWDHLRIAQVPTPANTCL